MVDSFELSLMHCAVTDMAQWGRLRLDAVAIEQTVVETVVAVAAVTHHDAAGDRAGDIVEVTHHNQWSPADLHQICQQITQAERFDTAPDQRA